MVCVFVPLIVVFLLTETSASSSYHFKPTQVAAGTEQASPCLPQWLQFRERCFAFYPVWSTWSSADSMCSQMGGKLASLLTPEERQFARQLASTHIPVWLRGFENGSGLSSDNHTLRISIWTNQRQDNNKEGGACMQMNPESGELHSAPCGELGFYICSTSVSYNIFQRNQGSAEPGIVPGISLFDVVWGYSDLLVEEILHSSLFLKKLQSDQLTEQGYAIFMQQEALYLYRVSSTLKALISRLQKADDIRSLLLDTLTHYSRRNQSLLASPPPQWLRYSLQSFHSLVFEEPIYWLVALSARASLHDFLARQLLRSGSVVKAGSVQQQWREHSQQEVAWTKRYRQVMEKHQDQMDAFKAINIFREHMMNQKHFYKELTCDI